MDSNTSVSLSPTQATPPAAEEGVLAESSLKNSTSHNSSSGTSLAIKASPSFDSDIKTDINIEDDKVGGANNNSSSVSNVESEDGFVSGEDEFETALERPFVADLDEEILESAMGGEEIAPIVVEPVVGSSILLSPEKDDDVVAHEDLVHEEDDGDSGVIRVPSIGGFEKPDSDVEASKEGQEDGSSAVSGTGGDEFPGATGIAATDSKTIEDSTLLENPSLVEKTENRVLGSEGEEPWVEKNPVSDSVSVGLEGGSAPGVVEASVEALTGSKENILPENPKLDEVVNPAVGRTEEAATELKDGVVEEKKSDILGTDNNVSLNSTTEGDSVVDSKQSMEVEENGVSGIKEVELPVENGAILDSGNNQANPVTEELAESKFVEADKDVNSIKEGESIVQTKQPISFEFDADIVGDVEENRVSETKNLELAVERSVSLGIVSDQANAAVEEPVTNSVVGTLKPELEESKTDLAEMEKYKVEKNDGGVNESVSMDPDNNIEKPELESEAQTDSGAKLDEPMFKIAANGYESGSSGKVDGLYETQIAHPRTKSAELNLVQEEKSHVLIDEESKHLENSDARVSAQGDVLEDVITNTTHTSESAASSTLDPEMKQEAEDEVNLLPDNEEEDEGSLSGGDTEGLIFDGSETTEQFVGELEQGSGIYSHSGAESSQDHSMRIDGQIVMESDEEADTDEEGDGKELFDSAALAALLKAATSAGSEGGSVTITSPDGSRLFSVERPAGLGSSVRSLKPTPRPNRSGLFTPSGVMVEGESENNLSEEEKKKLEKIQLIRVKFLRLVHRLGHSPEDSVAAQVLYRLVLAAGRRTSEVFTLETAKRTAMQLEAEGKDDLDFSLNILVLGKTGVGKSATINSIFGEEKALIDAFEPATTTVREIVGTVGGVKIRVFDTPGLRSSVMEQAFNRRILSSVKKFTKKCPPDILLYVDRLDTQTRDLNDLPLLRSVSTTLGSSIWRNAIVTLTHAASAPPDGPSGSPLSYEVFVAQRSHIVQQSIGQAVGDLRMMNPSLMNPVSLVENHPSCRRNREGQRVLPNGLTWRPQLLLFCYSMKILSEVNSLSKPQDPFDHRKLFGFRVRSPPLPYLLSSLLQSRAHPKLPSDQGGENVDSDIDLDDLSDSDREEEDEYDQLPPFKPLRKSQIAKLSKEQRKAYFDEYDYRVKLLQKKQWREELKRMREMKKKGKDGADDSDYMGMGEDADQENGGPAAVPVPLPDMVLPPSFDGDNPTYRFRFLEPTSQLLARPVLDTHGWDHDCGYDGVSLEENLAIAGRFPAGVAVQITKDKKEFNIHLDSSVAAKHGENGSTLAGFDIQSIGKQLAYIVRGETKFKNLKKNKTAGGISITFLGENVATGLKIEDQIDIGKCLTLVGSTGTVRSQGDVAYGANLEARLKEKDYPIGQDQSTLGLSLVRWRGDLALGANLQSQFSIGRSSKMSVRVGLNNKLSGQITVRTSSSEQLQIALVGILPIAIAIYRSIWPGVGEGYFAY